MKSLLLEALAKVDSAVLTEAVKTEISEAFDAAVEIKATEKAKALQESVEKATETYMKTIVESHVVDLKESFEKAVTAKAEKLSEAYVAEATKELKEKFNTDISELSESLEKYMQYAVDQFVTENKPTWEDELAVAKAQAIMESTVEFATKFGIKLDSITNEGDDAQKVLDESVTTVSELKAEVSALKRVALFNESTEGLTVVQKDKLSTLLEGVTEVEDYKAKLDLFKATLLESVKPVEKKPESTAKRSWEK